MREILSQPIHWSIAGVLIGLTVPALMLAGNKRFGLSSSFKHICAMCIPNKIPYFQYNWKEYKWLFLFIAGVMSGALIAGVIIPNPENIILAESTESFLAQYGISPGNGLLPAELFSFSKLNTSGGFFLMVIGGFLVGFGTRWAEGCTSGHSIYGLSTLQWPSLVATICFMAGGMITANFILPHLLKFF